MSVPLNVALQQQHDRYAQQMREHHEANSVPVYDAVKQYAGICNGQLLTKNGMVLVGTIQLWNKIQLAEQLVEVTVEIAGQKELIEIVEGAAWMS